MNRPWKSCSTTLIMSYVLVFLLYGVWVHADREVISLVRIDCPDSEMVRLIRSEHFDIIRAVLFKHMDLLVDAADLSRLKSLGVRHRIIHADLARFQEERASRDKTPLPGSMGGFHTFDEVISYIDNLHTTYPGIVSAKFSIGTSIQGRSIWCYKVSDNVTFDENEPEVFYNALIHAREPQGMECLLYYLDYLTSGYGLDSEATYLVDNREMYFVPVLNPDGYEYNHQTNPNGGGMWRKNRRANAGGSYGVDVNRNFGYEWGYDNQGSSPNSSSDEYRGTGPFSEPESQAVRDFCNAHIFRTTLNYHTYSNLLIRPFSYDSDLPLDPVKDLILYNAWGSILTRINHYLYGDAISTVGYVVNGGADDWMYGDRSLRPKIISFTPEVGSEADYFWPPPSRIAPLALENIELNQLIAWLADEYCEISSTSWVFGDQNGNGYPDGNEDAYLTISGQSLGLEAASGLSVALSCDHPDVVITNPLCPLGDVPTLGQFSNMADPYYLLFGPSLHTGDKITFTLTGSSTGFQKAMKTVSLVMGEPSILYVDDFEDGLGDWTISSTWGLTASTSHSPTYSLTDSPSGNYANYISAHCTMKDPISLVGLVEPTLTFWSRWDIESGYDFAQVLISIDGGSSWVPLAGSLTRSGSGDGVQEMGQPGYDGIQNEWIKETMNLSAYSGEVDVRLRFLFESDQYLSGDGWYIDDVTILGYVPDTVVPSLSVGGLLLSLALFGAVLGHKCRKQDNGS
ncbi:immune inhibitor A [bacterium]|nr:immune inhibitor A [bacterium]